MKNVHVNMSGGPLRVHSNEEGNINIPRQCSPAATRRAEDTSDGIALPAQARRQV